MDKDEEAEEKDLDVVIEVLMTDEVEEEDMGDDDVIITKEDEKLPRKARARHVRTKKFFSELRSLNLSSRRRHVHAEAEALHAGAVSSIHLGYTHHPKVLLSAITGRSPQCHCSSASPKDQITTLCHKGNEEVSSSVIAC